MGNRQVHQVSYSNCCIQQAQGFQDGDTNACAHAIGAAFQCLVHIGMLIPSPHKLPG